MPHWQDPGHVYFITWLCRKGQTLSPTERTLTLEAVRYWDNRKWTVYAAVVLADHVHVLVQPHLQSEAVHFSLREILHSIKSYSAHRINLGRQTQGPVWIAESYDRIMRDEAEFLEKWNYIRHNPVKAELVESPEDFPWLYEKS